MAQQLRDTGLGKTALLTRLSEQLEEELILLYVLSVLQGIASRVLSEELLSFCAWLSQNRILSF